MDWRERLMQGENDPPAIPFRRDVLVTLTGAGAKAVADHANQRGMKRVQWIRHAIAEQLRREGAAHVPDLAPYTGHRLLKAVERGH